jgi:hypothetical protein
MTWSLVIAAVGLIQTATRDDASPKFELRVEDRTPATYRLPDGRITGGYFDPTGDFVRDPAAGAGMSGSVAGVAVNDPDTGPDTGIGLGKTVFEASERVYEFRSGMLIFGTLRYPGKFTPWPGSEVISVDEYIPESGRPRIYNLPGKFVKLPAGVRPRRFALPPQLPGYALGGGSLFDPKQEFQYRPAPARLVGVLREKKIVFGRLNSKGTFIEDRNLPVVDSKGQAAVEITSAEGKKVEVPIINEPLRPEELVYEYRSGNLTVGRLTPEGEFFSYPGVIVISFGNEYQHSPDKPRIYNLPGEIVRRK